MQNKIIHLVELISQNIGEVLFEQMLHHVFPIFTSARCSSTTSTSARRACSKAIDSSWLIKPMLKACCHKQSSHICSHNCSNSSVYNKKRPENRLMKRYHFPKRLGICSSCLCIKKKTRSGQLRGSAYSVSSMSTGTRASASRNTWVAVEVGEAGCSLRSVWKFLKDLKSSEIHRQSVAK